MSKPVRKPSLTAGKDAAVSIIIRKTASGYALLAEMSGRDELFDPTTHKDRATAVTAALALIDRELSAPGIRIIAQGKTR